MTMGWGYTVDGRVGSNVERAGSRDGERFGARYATGTKTRDGA